MIRRIIAGDGLLKLALVAMWLLFVLYPNPGRLAASVYRLKNPPLAPGEVGALARDLHGRAPREIEHFVYTYIPYQFDWQVYNLPWYFPTIEEVLLQDSGDCKARFILFASLMEELDLPYEKKVSLTHIWVSYEGKAESALENEAESFWTRNDQGQTRFSLPRPDLKSALRSFKSGFWDAMPLDKKMMVLSGPPLIYFCGFLQRRQGGGPGPL